MTRKVEIEDWKNLSSIVDTIYRSNKLLSPYQSYRFLDTVGLGKKDTAPFEGMGYKPITFVLYRDESPVCVAPYYVKKSKSATTQFRIVPRGYFTSAGHLDFIYTPDYTQEDHDFLMKEIHGHFDNNVEIVFDRVSEKSSVYLYAKNNQTLKMKPSEMVTILLPDSYDAWFGSLSKSVRQNIRTSYNRLITDKKEYEFHFYTVDEKPSPDVCKDMLKLFCRRLCEHSKKSTFILKNVLCFLKKRNGMTVGIHESPYFTAGTVYISDGNKRDLVAFFTGFVGNDRRILVPRLSINMDYSRYSPGALLINETMKRIIPDENRNYSEFDLQRGDEPYKFSYGGTQYYNQEWIE